MHFIYTHFRFNSVGSVSVLLSTPRYFNRYLCLLQKSDFTASSSIWISDTQGYTSLFCFWYDKAAYKAKLYKMGLKDCQIQLDNPWSTYYSGQTVNGNVHLTLDSPKTIRGMCDNYVCALVLISSLSADLNIYLSWVPKEINVAWLWHVAVIEADRCCYCRNFLTTFRDIIIITPFHM